MQRGCPGLGRGRLQVPSDFFRTAQDGAARPRKGYTVFHRFRTELTPSTEGAFLTRPKIDCRLVPGFSSKTTFFHKSGAPAGWRCEGCGATDLRLSVHHCFYISCCEPWDHPGKPPALALRLLPPGTPSGRAGALCRDRPAHGHAQHCRAAWPASVDLLRGGVHPRPLSPWQREWIRHGQDRAGGE